MNCQKIFNEKSQSFSQSTKFLVVHKNDIEQCLPNWIGENDASFSASELILVNPWHRASG